MRTNRGRAWTVLIYAAGSAVVFGARLTYALVKGHHRALMDQFWLVVCSIGFAVSVTGVIVLGVQLIRHRTGPDAGVHDPRSDR